MWKNYCEKWDGIENIRGIDMAQTHQKIESKSSEEYEIPKFINSTYHETIVHRDVDGDIASSVTVSLCNFYFKIEKIMTLDTVKLLSGKILYPENENCKDKPFDFDDDADFKQIQFEIESGVFHDQKKFREFMAPYTKLWYKQNKIASLLTEITSDISSMKLQDIQKTQDWGWNSTFTAYLTDKYDFSKDESSEGSVKISDPKWQIKIDFGFTYNGKYKDAMQHFKDEALKIHPLMHKVTGMVYIAPLTSVIINTLNLFYILFLSGKSKNGKTTLEAIALSHFAEFNENLLLSVSDSRPAIEAVTYYHKDVINVIDNYKEAMMTDYERMSFMKFISDAHESHARTTAISKGFYVRGFTIMSGEETPQDPSIRRKMHVERMDTKIDTTLYDTVKNYLPKNRDIMPEYIKWLLHTYGDTLQQLIKDEYYGVKDKEIKEIIDPMLKLNLIGYKLFLRFYVYHKVIEIEDAKEMLKAHIETLKKSDIEKEKMFEEQLTYQRFIEAIRSGVTSGQLSLKSDPEYDYPYSKSIIGQTNREGTEVSIYDTAYPVIRSFNREYFNLPKDKESVYAQIKDNELNIDKTVKNAVTKKTDRLLTFDREILFPLTTKPAMIKLNDIATMLHGLITELKIVNQPTAAQHNELVKEMNKRHLVSHTKERIQKFEIDIEPLIISAYGEHEWKIP